MAGAMETVTAHMVIAVNFDGNRVQVSFGGHGSMKRSIENRHLWNAGKDLFTGLDTLQVGGIVKRCNFTAFFNYAFDLSVNNTGAVIFSPPWTTRCPIAMISLRDFITPSLASHREDADESHSLTGVLDRSTSFVIFSEPCVDNGRASLLNRSVPLNLKQER